MTMGGADDRARTVPTLIAHRGYPVRYPENTLPGLAAALEAGARHVEFDVQITADRVPVLLHDATLERTAGRPGEVLAMTTRELGGVTVGEVARIGPRFAKTSLPTLAAAVALLDGTPDVTAFVEAKEESLDRFGVEASLDAMAPALGPARFGWVLISFSAVAVGAGRARDWRTGWVLGATDKTARRQAEELNPDWLFVDHEVLSDDDGLPWPGEWRWVTYAVNDPRRARALADRGFRYVETDDVGGLGASCGSIGIG